MREMMTITKAAHESKANVPTCDKSNQSQQRMRKKQSKQHQLRQESNYTKHFDLFVITVGGFIGFL